MDKLMKLPHEVQAILIASVVFLIISFFDWQQVTIGPVTAGKSMWSGVGVIAGLLVIALLAWEVTRALDVKVSMGSVTTAHVSVGLAILLLVFTVITFLTHNEFRHWPSWIGLILSIAITSLAVKRAKGEGVTIPTASKSS